MKLRINNLRIQFLIALVVALPMFSCHAFKKVESHEPPKVAEKSEDLPSPTPVQSSNESKIDHTRKSTWQYTTTNAFSADSRAEVTIIRQNLWWASKGNSFFKSNDSGKTWRPLKLPISKVERIAAVEFPSERFGWLAIEDYQGERYQEFKWRSKIFVTDNGGDSWRLQYQGDGLAFTSIHFNNEREGWIGGGKYWKTPTWKEGSFLILHTTDQGQTWEEVTGDLTKFNEETFHYIYWFGFDERSAITFSDNRGRLFANEKNQKSWSQIAQFPNALLQDAFSPFAILDDGRIWAQTGADSIEGIWGRVALMSKDKSWDVFTINEPVYIADAILLADNEIVACGAISNSKNTLDFGGRDGLILHSKDAGKSWGVIYRSNSVAHISSLTKINEKHFLAIGDNGVVLNFISANNS
jgi:photosystem II stability/assembly factor-like uncharacterized protein